MSRTPVIGIMGGGQVNQRILAQAETLGRLVAEAGWILINGGRNVGVMAASARGAARAGGLVIGILPSDHRRDAAPDLSVAIVTGMADARNLINVLSSDVVIACPGQAGTLSEIALALKNHRPVITVDFDVGTAFESYRQAELLHSVDSPDAAIAIAKRLLTP